MITVNLRRREELAPAENARLNFRVYLCLYNLVLLNFFLILEAIITSSQEASLPRRAKIKTDIDGAYGNRERKLYFQGVSLIPCLTESVLKQVKTDVFYSLSHIGYQYNFYVIFTALPGEYSSSKSHFRVLFITFQLVILHLLMFISKKLLLFIYFFKLLIYSFTYVTYHAEKLFATTSPPSPTQTKNFFKF